MPSSTDLLFSSSTHRTYKCKFYNDVIHTTLTHVDSVVDDWIHRIKHIHNHRLNSLIVGLDVEWRPNSIRYAPKNPVAILQLCVGRSCLIFQLIHAEEIPQSLVDFLDDDDFRFVGVRIQDDVDKLDEDYGLKVTNSINLQYVAVDEYGTDYRSIGLKKLTSMALGKELKKPRNITTSDWSVDWLSTAQVQYACLDAFVSFEIGRVLMHLFLSSTHKIYNVKFYNNVIHTTLTHVASVVDDWIHRIKHIHSHRLNSLIVGLDAEWCPNSIRYAPRNPVAILQLCVGRYCLIFQLIHAEEIPQSLMDFLDDDDFRFVGVGIQDDVEKLDEDYGLRVANSINLQDVAVNEYGTDYRSIGLKRLTSMALGKELEKPKNISWTDWSVDCLSTAQVQYACLDAFASFEIGRVLIG